MISAAIADSSVPQCFDARTNDVGPEKNLWIRMILVNIALMIALFI
jgi:hypothetical protein